MKDLANYFSANPKKNWVKANFNSADDANTRLVKDAIQKLKQGTYSNKKYEVNKKNKKFFDDDFDEFLSWWVKDKHGEQINIVKPARIGNIKRCFYCGITEEQLAEILKYKYDSSEVGPYTKYKYHKSKKSEDGKGWNGPHMEIEKLDPNLEYKTENCVFACHICNNAKTDIIEATDFIDNIVPGIKKYYKNLK